MAGVTAFFHRGLCPLCGGGFRRCRFETLLFTPTEERRQMPSGLPPLRLWRGKDCKKGTPVNPGCFCFSGKCGRGFACVGAVLGKWCSGILTRLTGNTRELLPAGAPRIFRGVFALVGQCSPCLLTFQNPCRRAAHRNYSLFILHSSLISSLPIPCYNRQ